MNDHEKRLRELAKIWRDGGDVARKRGHIELCEGLYRCANELEWAAHEMFAIPETAVLADAGIELKPGIDPVIANHYHLVPKDMKCHKCGASEPWKHPSREEVSGVVDDPKTWEGIEKSWPTQPETAVLSEEQVQAIHQIIERHSTDVIDYPCDVPSCPGRPCDHTRPAQKKEKPFPW